MPLPTPTPVPDDFIHPDGRTEWRRRRDELWARETPEHPLCRGGEVEHVNGPLAKPVVAIQRR